VENMKNCFMLLSIMGNEGNSNLSSQYGQRKIS
jgi:hypothetical protein